MPDPSPASELRTAAASLRVAADPTPPCQHPGCGCCEGWHKQDSDGLTVCTGCDYDTHRYVSPGYPMPDGMGPLLADWLDDVAEALETHTHPGWQECAQPRAFAVARAINGPATTKEPTP